jgi:elongation factor P
MCIKHDNDLYRVVATQHVTPGNWRGMVQAKIRNLKTGSIIEHRFRSEDRVERAILDETEMEYLYQDGDMFHFMNSEIFESRPVGIDLPASVEMKVMETEPGIKGASVSNVGKPATMETGLIVQVPPFINEGDVIRIDTATGAYVERVSR